MDSENPTPPSGPPGPVKKFLFWLAGADAATLVQCPPGDQENVIANALLMIGVFLYQSTILALVAHRIFAAPGETRPELVLGAVFVAGLIQLIDAIVIMRPSWALAGVKEIGRGGLDISGGEAERVKQAIILGLRCLMSFGLAQITAVFFSLIIFAPDVTAALRQSYLDRNAAVITAAEQQVDGQIGQAKDDMTTQQQAVTSLTAQVANARETKLSPEDGDPAVQSAQAEVDGLVKQQAAADAEVSAAQRFSSDEIAGIKGQPGNTGVQGDGPVRRAAVERVANALATQQSVAANLAAARKRLDALRKQMASGDDNRRQQADGLLTPLQSDLNARSSSLASAQARYQSLSENRDAAVQAAMEASPGYTPPSTGLLAQITALETIAEDRNIFLIILAIDITSMGLELAAVLSKVIGFVPTTYATILAERSFLDAVEHAQNIARRIDRSGPDDSNPPAPPVPVGPAPGSPGGSQPAASEASIVFTAGNAPTSTSDVDIVLGPGLPVVAAAPHRPRGRPRKEETVS